MSSPEFSRMIKARHLPAGTLALEADEAERAALAERFGVVALDSLRAEVTLSPDKHAVVAEGRMTADLVQTCAVSGKAFPTRIDEPLALRFVRPVKRAAEEDLELPHDEPDEIEYEGDDLDLGEAIAQSLALAIDPYATGPGADAARAEAGIRSEDDTHGPLADLLKGLKSH